MRILVLDNSGVSYQSWYKMQSPNYEGQNDYELVDYARNYAKRMLYLKYLYNPDKTIILKDCTGIIWRNKVLNDYYRHFAKAWICKKSAKTKAPIKILEFDGKVYMIRYKPLKKEWDRDSRAMTKAAIAETFDINNKKYKWKNIPLDDDTFQFTPHYKGNRKNKPWLATTPKEHYKEYSNLLADKFAPHIDGFCIQVDDLEADELAYIVRTEYPDDEIIFVTNDTDWHQMGIKYDSKFYDPSAHKFHNYLSAVYEEDFWIKILGGDGGDNVPGCYLGTGLRPLAHAAALNKVKLIGSDKMYPFLIENADGSTLLRNLILISLKTSISYIEDHDIADVEDIRRQIKDGKPGKAGNLRKDFGVSKSAKHRARCQGQDDRKLYYHKKRKPRKDKKKEKQNG